MGKYNWKVKKKKLDVVLEESKMKTLLLFILILFLFVSLSTSMRASQVRSGQVIQNHKMGKYNWKVKKKK
jgi:hypothetical protein